MVVNMLITLESTEGAIKNGQSRETGNIGYTIRGKTTKYLLLLVLQNLNKVDLFFLKFFQLPVKQNLKISQISKVFIL
jgi:hypothetical protein